MIKCQIIIRWFGYFGLAPFTRIIECNESKVSFIFLTFTEEKKSFLMIFKLWTTCILLDWYQLLPHFLDSLVIVLLCAL